jgi:hypothetical protein
MLGSGGLTRVSTADLKRLLSEVHRETLPCPITQIGLATVGLLRLGDDLAILHDLEAPAVRAVLVAVLLERRDR